MNEIEKLLGKISRKERQALLSLLNKLAGNSGGLSNYIEKVTGTEFYRLKKGRYRIIFHYSGRDAVIDSIKLRNESTYKNL